MKMRVTVAMAASLAVLACNREEKRIGPAAITIGLDLDRTGSIATPSWTSAIDLAVQDANRGLQLAGRADFQFTVASANSTNTPDVARANAIDLVRNRGAKAIVTDSSQDQIGLTMLAYDADPANELSVPIVCMACSSPAIGNPEATDADPVKQAALRNRKGWGFRTAVSDAYQAKVVVRHLLDLGEKGDLNGDGKLRIAVYASDDPDGRDFAEAIRRNAEAAHRGAAVDVVFHPVQMNRADYDWAGDVAKVSGKGKKEQPDAVVDASSPRLAAAFTRAYLASGAKPRLLHTHDFRSVRVIGPLGDKVEGQEGTSQAVLAASSSGAAFADEVKATTGTSPAFRDASAYDAAMSLMLAAVLATRDTPDPSQVTGAAIRDAMGHLSNRGGERVGVGPQEFAHAVLAIAAGKPIDYDGASGPVDFDATGNVVAELARFRVHHGQFVDVERFDCVRNAECPATPVSASR